MAKVKTITLTTKELLEELKPLFFELFEQRILKKHGPGFTCSQKNGVFTATNKKVETPESTEDLKIFIAEGQFNSILFQKFLREHFKVTGKREQRSLQSRFLGVFMSNAYKYYMELTLEDFLQMKPNHFFKFRGVGVKMYIEMCQKFRNMGFNTGMHTIFEKEGFLKSGGDWRDI